METRSSPSLSALHRLAQQAGIPNYTKLSKSILYHKLKDQYNLERLQRLENRSQKKTGKRQRIEEVEEDISHIESSANSSSSSKRHKPVKLKPVKNLDPIMLAPLGRHVFTFERPNGTHGHFNVDTLVDYLISTGDFYDPETRIPFSDTDLQAIDSLAVQAGFSKESVHAAKLDVNKYKDAIFVRDALQGLERCAGEVITEILNVIEECDPEEAQLRLIISEFPSFFDLYQQIKAADKSFAHQCMKHWKLFLYGPPNRPTVDKYGLLQVVLMFLRECDSN